MVFTRPCRQAHTCGLTYWTVRSPAALQLLLEPEIEVRHVDADDDVGRACMESFDERAPQPDQPRQMRDHLDQAHDAEVVGRRPGLAAERHHLRPGHAEELRVGHARANGRDERRPERVARRLARDQPYPQRHGRLNE